MTESMTGVEVGAAPQLATSQEESKRLAASTAKPSGAKTSFEKRILKFVKDWGGVATVLIAILYTFPFDAAGKYVNWREQSVADARKAIFEVAGLYAAGTSAVSSVQDPQARYFLSNTYNIRIFNTLKQNQAAIESATNHLLSSELYMVGSLYALSGLPEAFEFYKLALGKAKTDDEKISIHREIGNARFVVGPNQDIGEARDNYLKALGLASKIPYMRMTYAADVGELGGFELMNGDWKCGQDISAYAVSLLDPLVGAANAPQQLRDMDIVVHNTIATAKRQPNQSAEGCNYKLPLLDTSLNAPTQPSPVSQGPISAQPQLGRSAPILAPGSK